MIKTFRDLKLNETVQKGIEAMGYVSPSPIQAESIPVLLEGKDIIGQAQTGTGKTLAFGSVLLSEIERSDHISAIVLSPTRELAMQIGEEFGRIGKYTDLRFACVYGGSDIGRQIRTIKHGIDVLIGTPGRVMDLMRREIVSLENIKFFVLDEADEMLNMGFVEDIETILADAPKEKQTVLFSATMPDGIKHIAENYMKSDYTHIKIKAVQQTATTVKQYYFVVPQNKKLEGLCRVLDANEMDSCIIFCKTKRSVDTLQDELARRHYHVACMHGDIDQNTRMRTLQKFKERKVPILIATDVAARGIDVDSITHVINYELPQEDELYVHRIGRTGRAGHEGVAFTVNSVASKTGTPIYRLYNRNGGGMHFYTASAAERDMLLANGWTEGKEVFYGATKTTGIPVYRTYNTGSNNGEHNYTTNIAEADMNVKAGWRAEGVAFYVFK